MKIKRLDKKLVRKIVKICMTPDDFYFEYIHGSASDEEIIFRMKEYVACVKKAEKTLIKKTKK